MGKNIKIDITLRDVISSLPHKFIELLTGKRGVELLDSALPEVKDKRADLIVLLEDRTIFHLELQSQNDFNMPYRMLEYFLLIRDKYDTENIEQMCLYVGDGDMRMSNCLEIGRLSFEFELKDIRDIDCSYLIDSEEICDKILSVLCCIEDEERYISTLISDILRLKEKERKDAIKQVLSLSRYRPKINERLILRIREEVMPITIELKNDPYFKQGLQQGIQQGIQQGVQKGKIEVAKNLIGTLDDEKIAKITGLDIEIIKKLRDRN
ncbi:MAG: hypothetical protein Q9M37_01510 [Desulfonauticus sp.]|nr:hypothetical protein [Desulfonauticus sp.]